MSASHEQPTYIDIMTQPFVEALNSAGASMHKADLPDLPLWMRPFATQKMVAERLSAVDWDATNLPSRDTPEGNTLSPEDTAMRLMSFAYGDALTLLRISTEFIFDTSRPAPLRLSPQEVLHKSAGRILLPASLDDTGKNAVISLLKARVSGEAAEALILEHRKVRPPLADEPLSLDKEDRLTWDPEVHDWIIARSKYTKGCPAHRKLVELNGQRVPLTHFFWHKFVDYAFAK